MANKTTAVATKDATDLDTKEPSGIVAYLESIKPKLEEAATRHLTPDRLIRVFLGIAARNPKIHTCTMESIVNALSQCTSTGLEPGGVLKHADLIPRFNKYAGPKDKNGNPTGALELNFQPRYGGLAELSRRSGEVTRVNASPVYQWELDQGLFEYSREPPVIRHGMDPSAPDLKDEDIVGGYAVAELVNGQRIQLWMSRAQIEKRRAASQAPSGNFWTKWYPEMVRKTLLRALFAGGLVPMSSELALAIEADVDMAYQPYDAPPVKTAAQRRIGAFTQVIEQEQLPASDTVAEVVSEWSKVRALAEDYQPTTEQIDGAASVLSLSIDRETWTKEQADAWLSELELALGVN